MAAPYELLELTSSVCLTRFTVIRKQHKAIKERQEQDFKHTAYVYRMHSYDPLPRANSSHSQSRLEAGRRQSPCVLGVRKADQGRDHTAKAGQRHLHRSRCPWLLRVGCSNVACRRAAANSWRIGVGRQSGRRDVRTRFALHVHTHDHAHRLFKDPHLKLTGDEKPSVLRFGTLVLTEAPEAGHKGSRVR